MFPYLQRNVKETEIALQDEAISMVYNSILHLFNLYVDIIHVHPSCSYDFDGFFVCLIFIYLFIF